MAEQVYSEPFKQIGPEEAKALIDSGQVKVVDVRNPDEYARDHIPGATLVPLPRILAPGKAQELLKDADNTVFVCEVGERSRVAAEIAAAVGRRNLYNLQGGMTAWRKKGYEVEK